jgi:hypothetical protein
MLAVLKAERGKCLRELRGLDAALETIGQLAALDGKFASIGSV